MTIAAIATYPGHAALGTIRVSGPGTLDILSRFVVAPDLKPIPFSNQPRHSFFAKFMDANVLVDEVVAVYFKGPHSYTGEDSAEITFHGNPILLKSALRLLVESGIRLAEPGEFTSRAFRNGRLDLTRAESVKRLIEAKSEYELSAARAIYGGELSRRMSILRSAMIGLKAETEAEVDFSTEDLTFQSREERRARVMGLIGELDSLLARGSATGRIREGISIAIVGVPNAGKSSLLNRLLGYDRAIVTEVAGTTRDTLSEELQIAGIPVRLVDTAGIRETNDIVEREGVRRSQRELEESTLVIHVIDGSRESYASIVESDRENVIHVINKADRLHPGANPGSAIQVSCLTGAGMDHVEEAIRDRVLERPESRDPILLEERHRFHLLAMKATLTKIMELWQQNAPDEITALEIDDVIDHIGSITGRISNEEILGRIFSTFCVGK